jgi:hypothetical protein
MVINKMGGGKWMETTYPNEQDEFKEAPKNNKCETNAISMRQRN